MKNIRAATWNICRGLNAKLSEIEQIIEANHIDILFLQEIDTLDFCPAVLHVPGFFTFVDNGLKKRTCTLICHNIFESITQISCCGTSPQVWLQATEHSGRKTILINVYREWCKNQAEVMDELKSNVANVLKSKGRIMLAGDFNLNPKRKFDTSYSCHHLTSTFLLSLAEMGLEHHSFGDTFTRTVGGKVISSELDWLACNFEVFDLTQQWYGISDHSLLLWKLGGLRHDKGNGTFLRNINKINRVSFATDLSMQPWETIGDMNLDTETMAMKFNSLFLEILDKHAPLRYVKSKRRQTPKPSPNLQRLRRQRDNARSKGQSTKLKSLRSECKKLARIESIDYTRQRVHKSNNNAWKVINETLGRSGQSLSNTITDDDDNALSMKEAAVKFNRYFIKKIKKIRESIPKSSADPLRGAKKRAVGLNLHKGAFNLRTVPENVVRRAIQKSKGSSCPDYYGISPAALKLAPQVVAVPLTWIINKIILTDTIPNCWKVARILPLHKKKSKNKVENYRPVSILPSASKIMEMIVQKQFDRYFEGNNILPSSQFGFRKNLSTLHAAGAADHDWKKSRQGGLACGALFFDLSAAFDTIDVDLLASKLMLYGAGDNVIGWLKSYLTGRCQCVDYGGESSPIISVATGSPQGSVISPLLFLILVADIEEWVSKAKALSYADDTTVYYAANTKAQVRMALELAAEEVLTFMQASMLSANPSKTKFVMFGRQREEPIKVGNVYIEESREEVLLGVTFNKSLTWTSHMNSLRVELKKRIGILRRLTFQLPTDLVKSMIQPVFTSKLLYGLALLGSNRGLLLENTLIKQLGTLHHQALKAALGIKKRQSTTYAQMLQKTGQKSVFQLALDQLGSVACRCLSPQEHALVQNRLEEHLGMKATRQSKRLWPPQSTQHSMVTTMVEVWEAMPVEVRHEQNILKRKRLIQSWSHSNFCDI